MCDHTDLEHAVTRLERLVDAAHDMGVLENKAWYDIWSYAAKDNESWNNPDQSWSTHENFTWTNLKDKSDISVNEMQVMQKMLEKRIEAQRAHFYSDDKDNHNLSASSGIKALTGIAGNKATAAKEAYNTYKASAASKTKSST